MIRIGLVDSVVQVDGPEALEAELSGFFPVDSSTDTATAVISVGPGVARSCLSVLPVDDTASAVLAVATLVNEIVLHQSRSFAVHAAVVARDGRAVAMPAPSGTGKSTLCAVLLTRGWSYVSDEALVLGPGGVLRPYPRPLALHAWTLERLGLRPPAAGQTERLVLPEELGAGIVQEPSTLADVVELRRAPEGSLSALRGQAAAALLLRHSFNHYRQPRAAFAAASGQRPRAWRLDVASPERAADQLELGIA